MGIEAHAELRKEIKREKKQTCIKKTTSQCLEVKLKIIPCEMLFFTHDIKMKDGGGKLKRNQTWKTYTLNTDKNRKKVQRSFNKSKFSIPAKSYSNNVFHLLVLALTSSLKSIGLKMNL